MNTANIDLIRVPRSIRGVPVCVVDTGFDARTVPGIIPVGWDTNDENARELHGTQTVSVLREVADPVEVHCIRYDLNSAVFYCANKGIRIINLSMSGVGLSEAAEQKAREHGIIIVTSAGNNGPDGSPRDPARNDYTIAVAAWDKKGYVEQYSSRGPEVDITAPTDWLIRLWNDKVVLFSGTSASSPVIAGVLSLYLQLYPGATVDQCKDFLYANALDVEAAGRDNTAGYGLFIWPERVDIVDWKEIILHHTATSATKKVEDIRQGHKAKGWVDIGYNYLVDFNGNVFTGRSLDIPGAHCFGHNETAIGIAAIGNFELIEMPDKQKQGIIKLVRELMERYNISRENIIGHRDVDATACPGKNFPLAEIIDNLTISDALADAVKVLQEAGIMNSPDYWLANARPGKQCSGEYAGLLIQRLAEKIKGGMLNAQR